MLLALGVGGAPNASLILGGVLSDVPLLTNLIELIIQKIEGEDPGYQNGPFAGKPASEIRGFLVAGGNTAIKALMRFAPNIVAKVAGYVTVEQCLQNVPILGPGLKILAFLATAAAIGQTVGEVVANPALFDNEISLTMDAVVTISRDPNDPRFPAQARTFSLTATYDQAVSRTASGPVAAGQVDPIVVTLSAVPSGGTVTIEVWLSAENGTLVGQAKVGPLENTVAGAGQVSMTITELLVPLTAATQYVHNLKLAFQNGAHAWVMAPAPTATVANLCQGQDNALCDLGTITVHTQTGMAGYGFQAGGQSACDGGPAGIRHTIQNVFLGQNPDRALKRLGCGFAAPVEIGYDPRSPALGRHFFLQPRTDGQGFDARSVVLDDNTPFSPTQTLTWGRFNQALDSIVVHPAGHLIGVNRQTHKMEILTLPDQPVDEASTPTAMPFSVIKSGPGTRAGLMNTPVAVTVSPEGTVLVLEHGNRRIQAFDMAANPVTRFLGQTTSLIALRDEGPGVVYADVGVEALGYIFVLSYVNNGQTAADYRLDVYDPNGSFLSRTTGVAAARMAVDAFRNVYTLNYETIANAPSVEPSLSQWFPVTPTLARPLGRGRP